MSVCFAIRKRKFAWLAAMLVFLFGGLAAVPAHAQEVRPVDSAPAPTVAQPAELTKEVRDARVAGNNAWVLTAAALVLLMTAPGLAMFYGGLVRKKNVLGVMMQCIFLMGLNSVIWALWGYSLAFGGDPKADGFNPWIGNGRLRLPARRGPDVGMRTTHAAITPMYTDSAGRPLDSAADAHAISGHVFHHHPGADLRSIRRADEVQHDGRVHDSMGDVGLLSAGPLGVGGRNSAIRLPGMPARFGGGALDFAGGTVVHISSGISALVCALLIGRRLGYGSDPMPPHNLTYTAIGAALLWVGWFGFNAGSQLQSDGIASSAFAATHLAAAAGALAWAVMEWRSRGKPSVLGACSGAVAGLVCITPASGYVSPMAASLIGLAAGRRLLLRLHDA